MNLKALLFFLVFFLWGNIVHAGIFDQLNPSIWAARNAAESIKDESIKLDQPYGLFGAYWGMLERDFLKKFPQCTLVQGKNTTYKEYRFIEKTKVSVIYKFKNIEKDKIKILLQIIIIPVINYTKYDDIKNAYSLFREYINNNIGTLSNIEYVKDSNGNVIEYTSSARFKYSKLIHMITMYQGRVIHTINFFKKQME